MPLPDSGLPARHSLATVLCPCLPALSLASASQAPMFPPPLAHLLLPETLCAPPRSSCAACCDSPCDPLSPLIMAPLLHAPTAALLPLFSWAWPCSSTGRESEPQLSLVGTTAQERRASPGRAQPASSQIRHRIGRRLGSLIPCPSCSIGIVGEHRFGHAVAVECVVMRQRE